MKLTKYTSGVIVILVVIGSADASTLAGNALQFDGTDDVAVIPRSIVLEPTQELTLECWVKGLSSGQSHAVLLRMAAGWDAGFVLRWQFQNNPRIHFQLAKAGLSQEIWVVNPTLNSAYEGQWHHVAAVYSATQNYARLYVDGIDVADQPGFGPLEYSGVDLALGDALVHDDEAFNGLIDEVRIWNVARTDEQISDNYNHIVDPATSGLVAYWNFDESSGQSIYDATSNTNNGVLGETDVSDVDDPLRIISGASLIPPSLELLAPNGAESLANGMSFSIKWQTEGFIDNISIEYSINNGDNWATVDTAPNTGSYSWIVPEGINSNDCLVRISDVDNPDTSDESDTVFTIFTCQKTLKADLDGNCYINWADFAIFASEWLDCGNPYDAACLP